LIVLSNFILIGASYLVPKFFSGGAVVEFTDENCKMQLRLALTEERDAVNAAEAVVEAAIWKRALRLSTLGVSRDKASNSLKSNSPFSRGLAVSEETRRALVQLVLNDPLMTPYLFTDEAWERH
jgi:hypothetical protein